ncbi:hypothetical protein [Flindersiella endophytica]
MVRLIAVLGSSPGVGKSTECERLHRGFAAEGLRVDHFEEKEIRTRAAFAPVWESYQREGSVPPELFLSSTRAYVGWLLAEGYDVAIADALMPYLPSLFAFGMSEQAAAGFLASLRAVLEPVDFEILYLDGDPLTALRRAGDREGPGWLDRLVEKVAGYATKRPVHDLETLAAYLRAERALTLRLLRDAGLKVDVRALG